MLIYTKICTDKQGKPKPDATNKAYLVYIKKELLNGISPALWKNKKKKKKRQEQNLKAKAKVANTDLLIVGLNNYALVLFMYLASIGIWELESWPEALPSEFVIPQYM